MAKNIQTAVFLVLLAAAVLQTTHATVYNVGNSTGWQTPTDSNFYSTWASPFTFRVGDSLVFNFATGSHDVATSSQSDYSSCNIASNALTVDKTGPVTIVLNTTGTHYYFCTLSNHCSQGQKLSVTVVSGTPSPSGSPGSVSPPPPPPSSGASSLMATFSVIFMSIAIFLLMW